MIKLILTLLASVFVFTSCGMFSDVCCDTPGLNLLHNIENRKIAVITFAVEGSYVSANTGSYAADKFSNDLFTILNLEVVDRSFVRYVEVNNNIDRAILMNGKVLKKLAGDLSADLIILGEIIRVSPMEFLNDDLEKTLNLNIRILDAESGKIVGMSNADCSYKDNIESAVDEAIDSIIETLGNEIWQER
ncbi:MAG: DUF3280 domain-containing protein [Melioribacteraceae bacterium]|nr:DUF3280 domain-containing protein [Melioribacteraceae bacterium]MCF8395088.1 DUF3280 domain-containing protein [Melioribacteraceae bacterium]MCF8420365.1 DUF3280 domain-containing protein [Melioribacteraceae bacterium]